MYGLKLSGKKNLTENCGMYLAHGLGCNITINS